MQRLEQGLGLGRTSASNDTLIVDVRRDRHEVTPKQATPKHHAEATPGQKAQYVRDAAAHAARRKARLRLGLGLGSGSGLGLGVGIGLGIGLGLGLGVGLGLG